MPFSGFISCAAPPSLPVQEASKPTSCIQLLAVSSVQELPTLQLDHCSFSGSERRSITNVSHFLVRVPRMSVHSINPESLLLVFSRLPDVLLVQQLSRVCRRYH